MRKTSRQSQSTIPITLLLIIAVARATQDKCSIYTAPSSIKGITGLGIYTTRDINVGDPILKGGADGAIPILDPNNATQHYFSLLLDTFRNTHWWSNGAGDFNFIAAQDAIDVQVTCGALPNHHCLLASMEHVYPATAAYDDSMALRHSSPGTGAFSYGAGREFYATQPIAAGHEVFFEEVPCDGKTNEKYFEWQSHIPLDRDFVTAARMVQQMWNRVDDKDPDKLLGWDVLISNYDSHKPLVTLLPQTKRELQQIMQQVADASSSKNQDEKNDNKNDALSLIARQLAFHALEQRSVAWIQQHGLCLENLVRKPSVLPHAGYGGFAHFDIAAGDVITPSPMIHLDKQSMHILNDKGQVVGHQLLLNYALSHADSEIILIPNTNAILINHCSNRSADLAQHCPDGPNAAFTWPDDDDDTHEWLNPPEWRNLTAAQVLSMSKRGIGMQVVALRDIAKGM